MAETANPVADDLSPPAEKGEVSSAGEASPVRSQAVVQLEVTLRGLRDGTLTEQEAADAMDGAHEVADRRSACGADLAGDRDLTAHLRHQINCGTSDGDADQL